MLNLYLHVVYVGVVKRRHERNALSDVMKLKEV